MSKLGGSIMMGVGILIAAVSGLCTLFFLDEAFTNSAMLGAVIRMGLVPFLVGAGLIYWGRTIIKRATVVPKDPKETIEP
jgi:protein-S-isoprenylcysteine O-methyltransferase Ste14